MLSQTAEYAMRAVVCLAGRPGTSMTAEQIAAVTKVPPSYLSKVLHALVRSEVIQSQRGLHGGFTLVRAPEEVTILDVVNAVDPVQRIKTCPLKLHSHGTQLCALHRRMDDVMAHTERVFATTTLNELLSEPSASIPLCDSPVPAAQSDLAEFRV